MLNPAASDLDFLTIVESEDPQKAARLRELATSIGARAKRMARDIYWQGRDLLEAKELFGHGRNQDFLTWAKKHAKVQTTLIYRFMQVAQAFPEFEEQDFEVVATALYAIASPGTAQAARIEFLERSLAGEVVSLPTAQAIIQRYQSSEDTQFERYQTLVQHWGRLERLETGDRKLRLISFEHETHDFRTYTELKQAFLNWRRKLFTEDLQTVQRLLAPDWSIRPCPVPNQPFRLEVICQIPGRHKTLIVSNPRTLIEWWYRQGQALSDRLRSDRADRTVEAELATVQANQFPKPTCLTCSWHESDHPGLDEQEFWCGFYRSAFFLEQAQERPQICRKWQALIPGSAQSPAQSPDLASSSTQNVASHPEKPLPESTAPAALAKAIAPPSRRSPDLVTVLECIATLTEPELALVEQAIAQRRQRSQLLS